MGGRVDRSNDAGGNNVYVLLVLAAASIIQPGRLSVLDSRLQLMIMKFIDK